MTSPIRGVYTITCRVNGRRYVGSSANIRQRWHGHRSGLRRGKHECTGMQADWDEHGASAFEFRVIATARDPKLRLAAEQAGIDEAIAEGLSYNICPTAGSSLGLKHTAETRQRMTQAALAAWQEGRREVYPGLRERMAELGHARKGKPASPEARARLLVAITGRPVSEETRRKMSEAQKGRSFTPEHRAAIGAAMRGRSLTDEHRQAIGDGLRGRPTGRAKLTAEQVTEVRHRLADGETGSALAREFGVSDALISKIKHGKKRADVA